MDLFIPIPSFAKHGGIRVIIEIANRMTKWHNVFLHSIEGKSGIEYWNISPEVQVVDFPLPIKNGCLLITSPHSIHLEKMFRDLGNKVFIHLQMMEDLFNSNPMWKQKCIQLYTSKAPILSISQWNIRELQEKYGRKRYSIHYIGNGINTDDFPVSYKRKSGKTILVEGWEAYNKAKDIERIGPKVASLLKREGYRIVAYGQVPLQTYVDVPDEYHFQPSLEKINELYEDAVIMIKASRYDARSCSPVEAMTKGTVTARAIVEGDDDLIDGYNCLRVDYNEHKLYNAAMKLLLTPSLRERLAIGCYETVKKNSWDMWISKINEIISS